MLFVQILGVIAFLTLFLSYYMKEKETILIVQIIAYVFYTLHYFCLGAFTGSLMEMCCILSLFLNYKNSNNKSLCIFIVSLVIIISGILSFDKWYSIIPIITSLITSFCLIYGNSKIIRFSGLIAAFGWGLYCLFIHSYAVALANALLFVFVIVTICLRRKNEG